MTPTTSPLKTISEGLADFFKDDPAKITYWLLTENPHFGGVSPAELIAIRGEKGLQKVAAFVKGALEENKPDPNSHQK